MRFETVNHYAILPQRLTVSSFASFAETVNRYLISP
jgi:hypothetical protein